MKKARSARVFSEGWRSPRGGGSRKKGGKKALKLELDLSDDV